MTSSRVPSLFRQCVALGSLLSLATVGLANVQIAIVRTAAWSPGDAAREGAGEFLVLMEGARLRKASPRAGLIVLGNQHGVLQSGGEKALRRLALTGVVVVRLARVGQVTAIPDALHLDASGFTLETTQRALLHGLQRYGPPPLAFDPDHPTLLELASIRAHLNKLQALFFPASEALVALH